jgi:Domain of unknown function (DUF1843)
MAMIPPYGVAIQDAIASGDAARMRQVAADAEEYLRSADEVRELLPKLNEHISRSSS